MYANTPLRQNERCEMANVLWVLIKADVFYVMTRGVHKRKLNRIIEKIEN